MSIEFIFSIAATLGVLISVVASITHFLKSDRLSNELKYSVEHLKFTELLNETKLIKQDIDNIKYEYSHLNDVEKRNIIDGLKNSLLDTTSEEILNKIKSELSENLEINNQRKITNFQFDQTRKRLIDELNSLTKRSGLNLAIGVATTLFGFLLLAYFVVYSPSNIENHIDLLKEFLPRLSLVIFIEIFAYFFLRLYKDTLAEIKYFQNEITNIESKYLAVSLTTYDKSEKGLIHAIDSLLATERNNILDKGQTTVEIEKSKTEVLLNNSAVEKILKIIHNKNF